MQIKAHTGVNRVYKGLGRVELTAIHHGFGGTEDHTKACHKNDPAEIVKIEAETSHTDLYVPSQHIEKVKEDKPQQRSSALGEDKGKQPPDLSLEDQRLIKAKPFI